MITFEILSLSFIIKPYFFIIQDIYNKTLYSLNKL